MNANAQSAFWTRYASLRERIHAISDQIELAGNDLSAMSRLLGGDCYPMADMKRVVDQLAELAEHGQEVLRAAEAKHENGIAADKRIDQLIAETVQ